VNVLHTMDPLLALVGSNSFDWLKSSLSSSDTSSSVRYWMIPKSGANV